METLTGGETILSDIAGEWGWLPSVRYTTFVGKAISTRELYQWVMDFEWWRGHS